MKIKKTASYSSISESKNYMVKVRNPSKDVFIICLQISIKDSTYLHSIVSFFSFFALEFICYFP